MDDQYRLNNLRQRQTDLRFVLEKTPLSPDARVILLGLLADIEKEIVELERGMRPN